MNVVQGGNAAELARRENPPARSSTPGGVELTRDQARPRSSPCWSLRRREFTEQHLVANGASNLIVGVLGDKGKHARAAFGVAALPLGAAVEVEARRRSRT